MQTGRRSNRRLAAAMAILFGAFPSAAGPKEPEAPVPVLLLDITGDHARAQRIIARVNGLRGFTVEMGTAFLTRPTGEEPGVREAAAVFRRGATPATVGAVLQALGLRVGVIVLSGRQAQIWTRQLGSRFAKLSSSAPANDPGYVARQVSAEASLFNNKALEFPLLRESGTSKRVDRNTPAKWWMVATIGTAIAAAAAVFIIVEVDEPHQRIQVVFP